MNISIICYKFGRVEEPGFSYLSGKNCLMTSFPNGEHQNVALHPGYSWRVVDDIFLKDQKAWKKKGFFFCTIRHKEDEPQTSDCWHKEAL